MKKIILVFLVIILPLLIIFSPFLFGNKIFAKGDILLELYPYWCYFQKSFSVDNQIPLWQPNMLSGFPLYASVIGGFFYPLNWIFFKFFDFATAYNWLIFIDFILLGLSGYWLGRILKLSRIPSLVISSTLVFSHFIFNYGAVLVNAHLYFILPLLFVCLYKIYKKKYGYILLGGVALGIGWLAGHLQFVSYVAVSGFLFALFLDWTNRSNVKKWFKQGALTKYFILIFIISLIIGSFQLIPTYELSNLSVRAGGLSYSEVSNPSLNPVDLINYILPDLSIPYLSSGGRYLYVSFLSFIFGLIAIFYFIRKNKFVLFFSLLFLFSFIASLKFSPIFWLLHQLPVFESFRVPARWMLVGTFSFSVLSGFGCQYLFLEEKREKFLRIVKILKYFVFLIFFLTVISTIIFKFWGEKIIVFAQNKIITPGFIQGHYLPHEHYLNIIRSNIGQLFNNLNLFNFNVLITLVLALASVLFVYSYLLNKFGRKIFLSLSLILIILNGLLVFGDYYKKLPVEFLTKEPETVSFIKSQDNQEPFRVYSLFTGLAEFTKIDTTNDDSLLESFYFEKEMIDTNFNIFYNIDSIDSYENLMSRRQAKLLAYLGSNRAVLGEKLVDEDISIEEKLNKFLSRLNFLGMSNVKYVVSPYLINDQRLKFIFETEVTSNQILIYLYENLEVMPRIYFAKNVEFINKDEDENFKLLTNSIIDFSEISFIECQGCSFSEEKSGFSNLAIEDYQDGFARIKTEADNYKWLIFSESNLPVWQAKIDGQITDIYTANYLYQSVLVPPGNHVVEFKYLGIAKK